MQASTSAQSKRSTSGIEVSELTPSSQPAPEPEPGTIDGNSYEVQEGDTLFSISNATQTRLTELVDLNELEPPYELLPGERLRLPERSRQTESQQQEPSQQEITGEQEPTSDLASEESVAGTEAGMEPGENEEERTETQAPDMSQPESSDIPVAAETGPISDPPALTGQGFSWPLEGEILSRYGAQGDGRHNDGINIAVSEGTVVHASENGVVAYAGNELRGFGNLLLVRHQDGWVTAYGHNSRLLVGRGAEVKRGQPIAEAGNSGSVSRPQLHFEIRKGTRAMDPLELLEE